MKCKIVISLLAICLLQTCYASFAATTVSKEAKKLEKQGWKGMGGSIGDQLSKYGQMQLVLADDATPRYIIVTATSSGRTLSEAKATSENTAMMMLSSAISSSVRASISSTTANSRAGESGTETVQRSDIQSSSMIDMQHCTTVISMYKVDTDGYKVQTTIAYDTIR